MKLTEFINDEAIIAELSATDRDGVIRELVESLSSAGAIASEQVDPLVAAIIKRESGGTTGIGKGVAIPHAKSALTSRLVGTIGRSAAGVDFGSLDGQPVYIVLLMLSPDGEPQTHLQAMNTVFSTLQQDVFRKFLRQSETREQIVELIHEQES